MSLSKFTRRTCTTTDRILAGVIETASGGRLTNSVPNLGTFNQFVSKLLSVRPTVCKDVGARFQRSRPREFGRSDQFTFDCHLLEVLQGARCNARHRINVAEAITDLSRPKPRPVHLERFQPMGQKNCYCELHFGEFTRLFNENHFRSMASPIAR